jgi:hypothetical protein
MKKICLNLVMPVIIGMVILSCSKEEAIVVDSSANAALSTLAEQYSVNSPFDEGVLGIDPDIVLDLPTEPESPTRPPRPPFQIYETPTQNYKDSTSSFDVSQLETHKTYHKIQNEKLSIAFFDTDGTPARVLKLNPGAEGWNANWGNMPYVESINPEVLYIKVKAYLVTTIHLSKPVTEFGLEIAPDHQNFDHLLNVDFGSWHYGATAGIVWSRTKSPSGARLFAIKSCRPFTTVFIWQYDGSDEVPARAFAIANIRYKLAE